MIFGAIIYLVFAYFADSHDLLNKDTSGDFMTDNKLNYEFFNSIITMIIVSYSINYIEGGISC
jgi:hypothetical protein